MPAAELEHWVTEVLDAFGLSNTQVDIDKVLSLAGVVAHGIVRPAAPLSTYLAGYAAGIAVGSGQETEKVAMETADALVRTVLQAHISSGADD